MEQDLRTIRKAQQADIEQIMEMCDHSRRLMRQSGNTIQWVNGYPSRAQFAKDTALGNGYVMEEAGRPVAYFAFIVGAEPTYEVIEDGQWIDEDSPYGTVHRLCALEGQRGIGRRCLDWCEGQVASVRADTHTVNHAMRHILEGAGYVHCGTIHVADGTPRMAFQKMTYPMVEPGLRAYVEQAVIPRHRLFDSAHQPDHIRTVMAQSMALARHYEGLDCNMVYAIAAYHDTGIVEGRELHHLASGRIVRADRELRRWFDEEQIETMAQAVEDHRASASGEPRSLYGRIVAEADRDIEPLRIVRRTVQFGLHHYPTLSLEGHFDRTLQHLEEKYGREGYVKLFIPHSRNQRQLERLRELMEDRSQLREVFEDTYRQEAPKGSERQ